MCQQVCVFLNREHCVEAASRPGLIWFSGRMWSVLGGFVDGLTGACVGALWDGGHCSCEPRVENVWFLCMQKARSCGGYNKSPQT